MVHVLDSHLRHFSLGSYILPMTLFQGARVQAISIRKTGPNFQSLLEGKDKYFHLPATLYDAAKKGRETKVSNKMTQRLISY